MKDISLKDNALAKHRDKMTADSVYTAVVTGASGFVASEVVKQLLEKVAL